MPLVAKDTSSETEIAFAAARQICQKHARSFYFASFFLPKPKREAAYAVYSFCRMIDDAIDVPSGESPGTSVPGSVQSCCSPGELDSRFQMLRDRLDEIYEGRMELPNPEFRSEEQNALRAFELTVKKYEIPKQYFLDVAEGCRMDLTIQRYPTWTSLERYCYHVAGVVGLIMSCIFGLQHSDAGKQAVMMGNAMQLTNILRDVKEDWERGRIYLPLEDLVRFKYAEKDLAAGVVNDAFRGLMKFEIKRSREMYTQASEGLIWLAGDGSRLTASTMAVIYAGILDAIESQKYDVFSRRASLNFGQKLRRIPMAYRLARRGADESVPQVFL